MECYSISISDLRYKFRNGQIELDPPYQRKPAWRTKQRIMLLSSLFNGIPIPSLIFHKHFNSKGKKEIYDVLDGKQRVETILHFIECLKIKDERKLWVEFINPNNAKKDYLFYDDLRNRKINKEYDGILEKFWRYELPIIEYEGELEDFFSRNVSSKEVFVRINSTGSPLTKNEIRHANYNSEFFDLGNNLEKKYKYLFKDKWKIISKTDLDRYVFHEFILELCTAIYYETYTDKRKKLEELLSNHIWTKRDTKLILNRFVKVINWIKEIFPKDIIKSTRFKNKSDFYSLFVVLYELLNSGYVTNNKKSNKIAGNFLIDFSIQIQKLSPKIQAFVVPKLTSSEQKLHQYVISTRQATDSKKSREIRNNYLSSILKDSFILKKKDKKRIFNRDVKDLLWTELLQKNKNHKCPNRKFNSKCKLYLTYNDAQVDHEYPWSRGGKTVLGNARLICSSCNKSKGNKLN